MMTPRVAARAAVGIGALVLSESLAWGVRAQNPPQVPALPPAIVSGVFVDSAGNPIPHGVLSVVGESIRVVTDSQGRFRVAVPPGPRLLAARALGYRPLMWTVALESGQALSQRVRLPQLSVVLPEITVVGDRYASSRLAGFYQRRRLGLGKYLDREAIERWIVMRAADLLQQIPGVRVTQSRSDPLSYVVTFARCNLMALPAAEAAPAGIHGDALIGKSMSPSVSARTKSAVGVYIDGFRVTGDPGEALSMINAADVEAIEVYRGPSELPAEFMQDDCAAIVIWTRY